MALQRIHAIRPISHGPSARALLVGVSAPLVLLAAAGYLGLARSWMRAWGATTQEQRAVLPGDDIVTSPSYQATNAITIHAPAERVWPWVAQLGQGRGGFYSHEWLENLFGSDIHSADRILVEHQNPRVGDAIWLARGAYGNSGPHQTVRVVEAGRALVLGTPFGDDSYTWAFVVEPRDADTTRLYVRVRSTWSYGVLEPFDSVMEREMLRGIAARAEGRERRPPALALLAHAGWVAAGAGVLGLMLAHRRGWLWLGLPVAATLPALLTAHDPEAALTGFLAVGIVTLGALRFGRRWWAALPAIAAGVLTIVLLASDVYAVFGVVFAIATIGVLVRARLNRRPAYTIGGQIATGARGGDRRRVACWHRGWR
jgi:hypothetical protein